MQTAASQNAGGVQSRSLPHIAGHDAEAPLQAKGAHDGSPVDPAGRNAQLPTEPARLQASQDPSHRALQQTPSAQKPEVHWLAAVQASPFGRVCVVTHAPLTHTRPPAQSAFVAQRPGHPASRPSHTKGEQEGSPGLPAATTVQVPTLPDTVHASQAAPHRALQQTPSTQKPEAHSASAVHGLPFGRTPTQTPPWHIAGGAQSLLPAHDVGHPASTPLQT